jgi:hypothetical protein
MTVVIRLVNFETVEIGESLERERGGSSLNNRSKFKYREGVGRRVQRSTAQHTAAQ